MKTISINAKCDDRCEIVVVDDDGNTAYRHLGDAWTMPVVGRSDYIRFQINVETGKIIGWDAEAVKAQLRSQIGEHGTGH